MGWQGLDSSGSGYGPMAGFHNSTLHKMYGIKEYNCDIYQIKRGKLSWYHLKDIFILNVTKFRSQHVVNGTMIGRNIAMLLLAHTQKVSLLDDVCINFL
jgi:hypothetical protein